MSSSSCLGDEAAPCSPKLRGYLEVKHCPTQRSSRPRLPRQWWRRQWVVLDIVETLDSAALIGRIYSSHMHEDRTLPLNTVTLTDVHALHRAQSRSHPFAFSIDGNCQCLILAGHTETETQIWMKQIRQLLWPNNPPSLLWQRPEGTVFDVSLIDNVHSDIVRLRGFYGQLVIDGRDVILVEARSGADQLRWSIKSIKKWFCAKTNHRQDKSKIIVIIIQKSCSSGEGIFTFYSSKAREIQLALDMASKSAQRPSLSALEGKKASKMNPLMAFWRRSSQQADKAKLAKSVSVFDNMITSSMFTSKQTKADLNNGGYEVVDFKKRMTSKKGHQHPPINQQQQQQHHLPPLDFHVKSARNYPTFDTRLGHLPRHLSGKNKKSASESDLLGAATRFVGESAEHYDLPHHQNPAFGHTSATGPPDPHVLMTTSVTMETVTGVSEAEQEGFYRSFDDIDDFDLGVLASSNPLEAAVVLRDQQQQLDPQAAARFSFNSSDSGRMSDTYAETSNSSVASSSGGHSNRLCSANSNCSADSGTHLSDSMKDNSSSIRPLEVLLEQISPNYPPFDHEIYGETISIVGSSSTGSDQHRSRSPGCGAMTTSSGVVPVHDPTDQTKAFATVRKSFTLPHSINAVASPRIPKTRKTKDLSKFLGLNDQGPGSPSKEVAQAVAMQNLPDCLQVQMTSSQVVTTDEAALLRSNADHDFRRTRPKSLGAGVGRRSRQMADGLPMAVNRTLQRLQEAYKQDCQSAPTTPEDGNQMLLSSIIRKKNLSLYLGIEPRPSHGLMKKSALSNSTPNTLETCNSVTDLDGEDDVTFENKWKSNDGLATPRSGGAGTPYSGSPPREKKVRTTTMVADKAVMTSCDLLDGENEGLNSMWNGCPCQKMLPPCATASATSSPFHTAPRSGLMMMGRGRSLRLSSVRTGIAGGSCHQRQLLSSPGSCSHTMARSVTLDHLDPCPFQAASGDQPQVYTVCQSPAATRTMVWMTESTDPCPDCEICAFQHSLSHSPGHYSRQDPCKKLIQIRSQSEHCRRCNNDDVPNQIGGSVVVIPISGGQKPPSEEPLRESSVDILDQHNHELRMMIRSRTDQDFSNSTTIVGVGMGGKTCISVGSGTSTTSKGHLLMSSSTSNSITTIHSSSPQPIKSLDPSY